MTDNEIKKALEEHYKQVEKGYTDHLAYGGKSDEHEEKYIYMLQSALDYINRLETENVSLNKEVDRLSQVVLYNDGVTEMLVEEAKAEAYKECIEKAKKQCNKIPQYHFNLLNVEWYLDSLYKELIGE